MKSEYRYLLGLSAILIPIIFILFYINKITSESTAMYIFNPYKSQLSIEIDDERYELKEKEKKILSSLSIGKHKVKSIFNGVILFDTIVNITKEFKSRGGLINLSKQEMFLVEEIYSTANRMFLDSLLVENDSLQKKIYEEEFLKKMKVIKIDSTLIYGNIKEYSANQIILVKEWYFDIDENFEEEILSRENNLLSKENISKLFSKEDMLIYWNKNYLNN